MRENSIEFQEKFRVKELKIWENALWIWLPRSVHCTIGAGRSDDRPHVDWQTSPAAITSGVRTVSYSTYANADIPAYGGNVCVIL